MHKPGRPNGGIDILKHVTSACKPSGRRDGNDGKKTVAIIDDRWPKPASSGLRGYSPLGSGLEVGLDSKSKPGSVVACSIE